MFIDSVMPSNRVILCHPLLLLPLIFPSIRFFSSELALRIRWPKYWRFSFSNSSSSDYSGLISFRTDWFDVFAVQVAFKSLLQHHNSKAPIIQCSATSLSLFTFMRWRRKWQPTPVFLPGESQGQGSLVGCRLWGHTESDTTEVT